MLAPRSVLRAFAKRAKAAVGGAKQSGNTEADAGGSESVLRVPQK